MRGSRFLGMLLAPALGLPQSPAHTAAPAGAGYVERELRVPVIGAPGGLDVLEVYLSTPGKHPLALLTHGTSDKQEERMQLTPWMQLGQALWFAERGYVALVVIRQGYGHSPGTQDGSGPNSGCHGGSFEGAGDASAADLKGVAEWAAKHLPEADTDTVVSAGVPTGGFAQVALAAHPMPGLKAAIDFAGGRGGNGKGDLCNRDNLLAAYKAFGKKARVPMLWVYAANDKWFPLPYAHAFQTAFDAGGGVETFVEAPPDGDDGHHLYGHPAAWSATVADFLREHNLLPVDPPYPPPPPPRVDPPPGLGERGIAAFNSFLILGPYKAFATDGHGRYGFVTGMATEALADAKAVENCSRNNTSAHACVVVAHGSIATTIASPPAAPQ